jgi:uncharacterized membrane protein YeaQ/YmgE (transglycosylase-associated protein family)
LRGFQLAGRLILLRVDFQNSQDSTEKIMLHLIWYVIVGFLAGCVAKALMHTHLSITWTVVLGIVGSIIGGAVTHLFYPPSTGGRFHPGGLIVSILGAILVLYLWHRFRLQSTARLDVNKRRRLHSRRRAWRLRSRHALQGTQLT